MLFTEPVFFAFFAAVFAVAWLERSHARRKLWLLAASYLFYAGWDWRFLSLIAVSTLVDFGVGLGLARGGRPAARRTLLVASLAVNLGILAVFKYYGFFVESAVGLLSSLGLEPAARVPEIVLPVGISFYTFQTLSYTIDVYRGKLAPVRSLTDFALFVGFFPQLVAGPIVRAADFLPQLESPPRWRDVAFRRHLTLFLVGFVKKACVADNLAPFADRVFAAPEVYTALAIWTAVALYAVQIYCDFSGYTDMAIACAGLLGYRLARNFEFPYVASSAADFWRRWHVSLSTWLRDNRYIPLGGSRGSRLATHRNLLLTMLLGGLWHGAAWTFVAWGALHGLALAAHREWRRLVAGRRMPSLPGGRAVATALT
ncbi:MAG TPA: MBOAT family O-acyltransferase, partial [Thermoanaerobaculia bacterium]|nr:MBOAT family O-acyltransferase [Thermoanaerobaculia bacterium]